VPNTCITNSSQHYYRLASVEEAQDTLAGYTNGIGEEQKFVAQTQSRINAQPPVNGDIDTAKTLLNPTMVSAGPHLHAIVGNHSSFFFVEYS